MAWKPSEKKKLEEEKHKHLVVEEDLKIYEEKRE